MVLARLMSVGLALSLIGVLPTAMVGTAAAQGPPSPADIQTRDRLIADQEALLNSYRCRFDIDTQAVPGGCQGGRPARPAAEPVPFGGTPTSNDLAARDKLVSSQEALLNLYRCRFDIDTQAVPGGCVGGAPARVQEQINVGTTLPSGRCAHTIASGLYGWERCAWDDFWENRNYNYPLSDAEGQALVERIWAEVDVEGKPANPPTSELVPAGSTCATAVEGGVIVACYQHTKHHIRRLDSFLQTLLHEAAHALVALHPSIQACQAYSDTHEYNACTHNDVFRCAADHLFVRYAGIPSAGVCGKTVPQAILPDDAHEWVGSELDGGGRIAGIPAYTHTRGFPYEGSDDWLFVRCDGERLEVFLAIERGSVVGQRVYADRIPVTHVFLPSAFFSWEEARQNSFIAANRIWGLWGESTDNSAAFLPARDQEAFINAAADTDSGWLMASVEDWDGTDLGVFLFSLKDAYAQLRPVTEECGWTWQ